MQGCLNNGTTAYSVDLRGFTDYFPLSLQMMVLDAIIQKEPGNDLVSLFEEISTGPWRCERKYFNQETIVWKRGQPLGLYPSFPLAALTHGLVLLMLNNHRWDMKFFILGDDVVILDSRLHEKYLEFLMRWGCPVSTEKCLDSDSVCEFAGKIITRQDIIPQFKWRQPSDDNFLDLTKNFGKGMLRILKPKQRKIAHILMEVPDFMGGLGFNPKGIPLEERVYRALKLMPEKEGKYLLCYNGIMNGINHNDTKTGLSIDLYPLDMKGLLEVFKHLPSYLHLYEVLGKNLFSISPEIPLSFGEPLGHKSLLDQLSYLLL